MIDLRINGVSLVLYPETDVPMELLNGSLSRDLDDSFALPFQVPQKGNEVVLGYVQELAVTERTIMYKGASLYYAGDLKHTGILYVESAEDGDILLSFSVDGFVSLVNERTLLDVDYGRAINIMDEARTMAEWGALRNAQSYPQATHCFPMFVNTELQSAENPSWHPDHPEWKATQAYGVNDLVSFEEGTIVRRAVNYQCTSATSAGQSPATHPSKWRRTAFGIVNHWDHVTETFFENNPTDGNMYAMIPFFYLKWVLIRVFATLGYELRGDFMDDSTTHQVWLYNNTAVDDGSRRAFFAVTNSTPQVAVVTPMQIDADVESGGVYSDTDNLWNNVGMEFTVDAAGRRTYNFKFNAHPDVPSWYAIWMVDVLTNVAVFQYQPTTDMEADLIKDVQVSYTHPGGHVGRAYKFMLVTLYRFFSGGAILTTYSGCTINSMVITSFRDDTTNAINPMALFIEPRMHVPSQGLAEFILDVCESFTLERNFDHRNGVAYLNYRKHVLSDPAADVTPQVRGPLVIRYQELPKGYRFSFDGEGVDEAEIENRTEVASVATEADLVDPPDPRSYQVVRNSRRLYVSKFNATGTLYWYPAGWLLPAVTIGSSDGPEEVKPSWSPMMMDLVTSNGEEFLVPTITEAGNSVVFGTTKNEGSRRWGIYYGLFSNANGKSWPFASSYEYRLDGVAFGNLCLAWDGDVGLLANYGTALYQALSKAFTLEAPMELNKVLLDALDNRPVLIQNQRCIVERLPVTYTTGRQPLVSEGATLIKLPAP